MGGDRAALRHVDQEAEDERGRARGAAAAAERTAFAVLSACDNFGAMIRPNAITLELKYPAPIPVGNRIEVLWVQRNVSLFASEPSWETIDGYCAVKDLNTGIEHGMSSDFTGLDQAHPIAARLKAKVV